VRTISRIMVLLAVLGNVLTKVFPFLIGVTLFSTKYPLLKILVKPAFTLTIAGLLMVVLGSLFFLVHCAARHRLISRSSLRSLWPFRVSVITPLAYYVSVIKGCKWLTNGEAYLIKALEGILSYAIAASIIGLVCCIPIVFVEDSLLILFLPISVVLCVSALSSFDVWYYLRCRARYIKGELWVLLKDTV
jgi:hypothetical protein